MNREERPIVFTISNRGNGMHVILTKDPRGVEENVISVYADELFRNMVDISEVLNNKGYAVLFEVN